MKATHGESTKTKIVQKAMSTKAKSKKPKGGNATKKSVRKKTSTSAAKKKNASVKKTGRKKQMITDTDKKTDDSRQSDSSDDDPEWEAYHLHSEKSESDAFWNENYRRLQEFHSTHGHSGVPIHWRVEPQFADWVSRQRQFFREIQSGYRRPSIRDEGRWKRLQILNFPLDYEKWHWQQKYNELIEVLHGEKYDENNTNIPETLKVWANHQIYLNQSDVHSRIDSERRRGLEILGVLKKDNRVEDCASYSD
ncbi:unnamed protein product [Pseudo-nitzschia multistriata]|uniref:Helicase-associated domain-containing protein n=1 Tax=Pseudo-nitzschia multistriata TaxID=183589 RepID=A0A448ZNI4_9STRA|nr:unnamed protein product [Pseudo-nitzschia multistriata]